MATAKEQDEEFELIKKYLALHTQKQGIKNAPPQSSVGGGVINVSIGIGNGIHITRVPHPSTQEQNQFTCEQCKKNVNEKLQDILGHQICKACLKELRK